MPGGQKEIGVTERGYRKDVMRLQCASRTAGSGKFTIVQMRQSVGARIDHIEEALQNEVPPPWTITHPVRACAAFTIAARVSFDIAAKRGPLS